MSHISIRPGKLVAVLATAALGAALTVGGTMAAHADSGHVTVKHQPASTAVSTTKAGSSGTYNGWHLAKGLHLAKAGDPTKAGSSGTYNGWHLAKGLHLAKSGDSNG
jgi:hypothetical protein